MRNEREYTGGKEEAQGSFWPCDHVKQTGGWGGGGRQGKCRSQDLSFYSLCAGQVALRDRVKTTSRPHTHQRKLCSAGTQGQSLKISVERLNYHLKVA